MEAIVVGGGTSLRALGASIKKEASSYGNSQKRQDIDANMQTTKELAKIKKKKQKN